MERVPSRHYAMHAVGGPGTELGKLIPDWLAKQSEGCNCSSHAKHMDDWGVDGCIKHRETIVKWLVAQNQMLPLVVRKLPDSALRVAAGIFVDCAIHNAKIKAEQRPDVSDASE